MSPFGVVVLAAGALIGLRIHASVRLANDVVIVDATAEEPVDRFRRRMTEGPDVLAGQPDRVVRRFRGRGGRFRYETVELVCFVRDAVTFEHLAGPFARCHEMFALEAIDDRTRITHSGTFALRGGVWTWPLAQTVVKRAFEGHVHEHLLALRDELGSVAS